MDIKKLKLVYNSLMYKINILKNRAKIKEKFEQNIDEGSKKIIEIADELVSSNYKIKKDTKKSKGGNLETIFNIINSNDKKYFYDYNIRQNNEIIFPKSDVKEITSEDYNNTLKEILKVSENLKSEKEDLEFFLQILEKYLSYVPYLIDEDRYCDSSIYDHIKLMTAYASSIYEYSLENELNFDDIYDKKIFKLAKFDISGVQNFIYNIIKENALKSLRTRSFYLEIIMEVTFDEILERLDLTRANILYIGGGGGYLIIPNTLITDRQIEELDKEINSWFMNKFGIELYLNIECQEFSPNDIMNIPKGSYNDIFAKLSEKISDKKRNRYSSKDLMYLNDKKFKNSSRECKNCNRIDELNEENYCSFCDSLNKNASKIIEYNLLLVDKDNVNNDGIPLPFSYKLKAIKENEIPKEKNYFRIYEKNYKNSVHKGRTNILMGDYVHSKILTDLKDEHGFEKLAALRADVDNLGQTFRLGFYRGEDDSLQSINRTATLSREMANFFKLNINNILENPEFKLFPEQNDRKCNIIYAGGDDLFIIGSWQDLICFSIDLRRALNKFSLGSLTISAGLGIYDASYPISNIAMESGELETAAKSYKEEVENKIKEKNAICVFDEKMVFSWDIFENNVIGEKFKILKKYIEAIYENELESGNSFLYKLLSCIRDVDDKINFSRILYLIARKSPNNIEKQEIQKEFSQKIYNWAKSKEELKELEMAIIIYIYANRGGSDEK